MPGLENLRTQANLAQLVEHVHARHTRTDDDDVIIVFHVFPLPLIQPRRLQRDRITRQDTQKGQMPKG